MAASQPDDLHCLNRFSAGCALGLLRAHQLSLDECNAELASWRRRMRRGMRRLSMPAERPTDNTNAGASGCAGFMTNATPIMSVAIASPTVDALRKLVKHSRSAVAVLSPEGNLITNLSSSDLRCVVLPRVRVHLLLSLCRIHTELPPRQHRPH